MIKKADINLHSIELIKVSDSTNEYQLSFKVDHLGDVKMKHLEDAGVSPDARERVFFCHLMLEPGVPAGTIIQKPISVFADRSMADTVRVTLVSSNFSSTAPGSQTGTGSYDP